MRQGPENVDAKLLDALTLLASQAAAAILAITDPALTRRDKPDRSPATDADEAAEAVILRGLTTLMPGVPVVSEEAAAHNAPPPPGESFILVDPLDGTRELIAGETEFTVNIAVISGGAPVIGVIAAPALGLLWRGLVGHGAERLRLAPGAAPEQASEKAKIRTRARPAHDPIAVVSRFHRDAATDAYLDRWPDVRRVVCGSSVKFCRIAEGAADLYPRMTSISEWDIAAGHALVTAAGGAMTTWDGGPVTYGRPGFHAPGFIVVGDRAAAIVR